MLVRLLDEQGRLDEDLIVAAAADGEAVLVAEALARRAAIAGEDAFNLLLGGDGDSLMLLLRMAGASRELAARLLAGPGDLLEIADAGRAIARFDAITQDEVEFRPRMAAARPLLSDSAGRAGTGPWPAHPLNPARSWVASIAPAAWSRPIAELATLQMEAGSSIGATLALPQVAAVARLARKLGIPVSRPAVAAGSNQDIDLWVRAVPEGEEVSLTLEGWTVRPAASARLATLLGGDSETRPAPEPGEWAADEDLQLTSVSASLAEKLGAEAAELIGQPLMRIFRLEENEAGELPLVAALAARHGFAGQPARARSGDPGVILS